MADDEDMSPHQRNLRARRVAREQREQAGRVERTRHPQDCLCRGCEIQTALVWRSRRAPRRSMTEFNPFTVM